MLSTAQRFAGLCSSSTHCASMHAVLLTAKPQLILPRRAPIVRAAAAPTAEQKASPIILNGQVLHSITSERLELVRGLEGYMRDHVGAVISLLWAQAQQGHGESRRAACEQQTGGTPCSSHALLHGSAVMLAALI